MRGVVAIALIALGTFFILNRLFFGSALPGMHSFVMGVIAVISGLRLAIPRK